MPYWVFVAGSCSTYLHQAVSVCLWGPWGCLLYPVHEYACMDGRRRSKLEVSWTPTTTTGLNGTYTRQCLADTILVNVSRLRYLVIYIAHDMIIYIHHHGAHMEGITHIIIIYRKKSWCYLIDLRLHSHEWVACRVHALRSACVRAHTHARTYCTKYNFAASAPAGSLIHK